MSTASEIMVSRGQGADDGTVEIETRRTRWPHRRIVIRLSPDAAISLVRLVLQAAGAKPATGEPPTSDDWAALRALVQAAADNDLDGCAAILNSAQNRRLQLITASVKLLVFTVANDMSPDDWARTVTAVQHAKR